MGPAIEAEGIGCGVLDIARPARTGVLFLVPHAPEVVGPTPIPGAGDVPLIGDAGAVAVVEVDVGVDGRAQSRHLDPGDKLTGGIDVLLDFVIQLGNAVGGGEQDVPTVGLLHVPAVGGVGPERVGGVDQDREVGQAAAAAHLAGIDRDPAPVLPIDVVPVAGADVGAMQVERIGGGDDRHHL